MLQNASNYRLKFIRDRKPRPRAVGDGLYIFLKLENDVVNSCVNMGVRAGGCSPLTRAKPLFFGQKLNFSGRSH